MLNIHLHTAASYRDQCIELQTEKDTLRAQVQDAGERINELLETTVNEKLKHTQQLKHWEIKVGEVAMGLEK